MAEWIPGQPNVTMKRVEDFDAMKNPGEFYWRRAQDGAVQALVFRDNRGRVHSVPVTRCASPSAWNWDGDEEKPTLSPSILSWSNDSKGNRHIHWHGYVRGGVAGFEC